MIEVEPTGAAVKAAGAAAGAAAAVAVASLADEAADSRRAGPLLLRSLRGQASTLWSLEPQ